MHRIPYGRNQTYTPNRPVILHQHGLFDSSDAMVCHGPDLSPAYYLANAGYDVWLSNERGNKYALDHVTLNTSQPEFWNFSLSEALYDSQANIDYIRNYTNSNTIAFSAHSFGTGGFFAAASRQNDWYRDRLSIFIALAPVTQTYHEQDPIFVYFTNSRIIFVTLRRMGIVSLFPSGFLSNPLFQGACRLFPFLCDLTELFGSEADPEINDDESVQRYYTAFPSSSSLKNMEHDSQLFLSRRFQDFDYGTARNMIGYGTPNPPAYNVTNINGIPVALIHGTTDEVSEPQDVQWLIDQLGDNVVFTQTYNYGHLSFFTGINMAYLDDIDNLLRQYPPTHNDEVGESP